MKRFAWLLALSVFAIAAHAADFMLPDIDGNPYRLSDYRGKKVFVVSWASW